MAATRRSGWLTAWLFASLLPLSVSAQDAGPDDPEAGETVLEEVIVVATKRERTLAELPVAVSVVSGETLERAFVRDLIDLQTLVPSLRVSQLERSSNTIFFIRGFGNGNRDPGIEPSVGIFVDGVYRSRAAAAIADLPEVERIEVLRGPQSTLFGKNASAGVVNVITAVPDMAGLRGLAEVTPTSLGGYWLRANVSGPISESLGAGLAVNAANVDGYFTELTTGAELNNRDRWGVRGQLFWLPTDRIRLRLIADAERIDELCCGAANLLDGPTGDAVRALGGRFVANEAFAYENFLDALPVSEIENAGISLQADVGFGDGLDLTSITAWRTSDQLAFEDADFTSASLVKVDEDTGFDTFTQELRLAQSRESFDWMIGAFWLDEDVQTAQGGAFGADTRPYFDLLTDGAISGLEQALIGLGQIPPEASFFAAGAGIDHQTEQAEETLSFFGQLDWRLTDRLTLTAGANYTEVDKAVSARQASTDLFSALDLVQVGFGAAFFQLTGLPPTPGNIAANPAAAQQAALLASTPCSPQTGPACNPTLALQPLQFFPTFLAFPNTVEPGTSRDTDTTWTLRAAYQLNDNVLIYASAATGFKPTSWNLTPQSRPAAADLPAIVAAGLAGPGLRTGSRFAGPEESTAYEVGFKGSWPRFSLNLALFDQAIEGFQRNVFTGTGFVLLNAGKQSTTGLEIDSSWLPADDWQIRFAATWLDPVYDSFPAGEGVGGPQDLSGTRPAGISELSISTSATWSFALGNAAAYLRGEYVFEDEVQVVENVPAAVASREVNLVNASAGFAWDSGWELELWVRNLTDDRFLTFAFPTTFQPGSFGGFPNQPRNWGVTGRVRF